VETPVAFSAGATETMVDGRPRGNRSCRPIKESPEEGPVWIPFPQFRIKPTDAASSINDNFFNIARTSP